MKTINGLKCPHCDKLRPISSQINSNAFVFVCAVCGFEYCLVVNRANPSKKSYNYFKMLIEKMEKGL